MEKPVIGLSSNPKAKELQTIYVQKMKSYMNSQKTGSLYGSRKLNDIVSQSSHNPTMFEEDNLKRISGDDQQIFGDDANYSIDINQFEGVKSRSNLIELKREESGIDIAETELEKNYFRIKNIQHANAINTGYLAV